METTDEKQVIKSTLKKLAVYSALVITFAVTLYFIFASTAKEDEKQAGINSDLPMPKDQNIAGDKKSAYEKEQLTKENSEKIRTLEDFQAMIGTNEEPDQGSLVVENKLPQTIAAGSQTKGGIGSSVNAYQNINRTLGNFYEAPKVDPEKERLKEKVVELRAELSRKSNESNIVDDQVRLLEKSYQMAAKYFPTEKKATMNSSSNSDSSADSIPRSNKAGRKSQVASVHMVERDVVSTVGQSMKKKDGFITAVGEELTDYKKNTIEACITENITVIDGQAVKLRLLEPISIDAVIVPKGSLLTAIARIDGDRLSMKVTSIEHEGRISAVELLAYDVDGQQGIYIPSSMEAGALKEIGAGMGQSVGTSITINQNTTQQILGDLTKGLLQGTSQYLSRKVKQVKVTLKSGYKVLLLPKNQ